MLRKLVIVFVVLFIIPAVAFADSLFNMYRNKVKGTKEEKTAALDPVSDLPAAPPPSIRERDLITVLIEERAIGTGTSSSATAKNTDFDFSIDRWFNIRKGWKTGTAENIPKAQGGASWETEGSGKIDRRSTLQAKVKVMVMQVYPNGNLLIEGQSTVTIGEETNRIIITGIIQTRDISQRLEVYSSSVYDLRVVYNGTGMITDATNPGWLSRFINRFWPF